MIVTAWNNGMHARSGAGYGFKISVEDRDTYFQPDWDVILLELDGEPQPMEVNINKASFWNVTCHELIHINIGRWLRSQGLAPWSKGNPPKFILEPIGGNRFKVSKTQKQPVRR